MVEVDDPLLDALWPAVDFLILLALLVCQSMQTEEEAILGLKDMLFGFVAKQATEVNEIGGVADRRGYRCGIESQLDFPIEGGNRHAHCLLSSARFCAGDVNRLKMRVEAR